MQFMGSSVHRSRSSFFCTSNTGLVESKRLHMRRWGVWMLQVRNVALASKASLQADMDTLQATIARLQGELGSVLGEFSTLQDEAQQIEGVVVDEVGAPLQAYCSFFQASS